jgi:hypothetical protein
VSDSHALPANHPLKPLEERLLQMAQDAGPMRIWVGNCIAALRVFAAEHPDLSLSPAPPPHTDLDHDAKGAGCDT